MPFGYTRSPLKLTKGNSKCLRCFGSKFSVGMLSCTSYLPSFCYLSKLSRCCTFDGYHDNEGIIMWLPDSFRISLGKQCRHFWCNDVWVSSAWHEHCWLAFGLPSLRTCTIPPAIGPSVIVLISLTTYLGLSWSSSLWLLVDISFVRWPVWKSFLTNFWSFTLWINSSIYSFKSRHLSV